MLIAFGSLRAQKPTAEKQDQIIQSQTELKAQIAATEQKIEELNKRQMHMESLYASDMNMANQVTKMSYAYGVTLADGLQAQGVNEIDFTALVRGLYDAMTGNQASKMTLEQSQQFLNEMMTKMMAEKAKAAKEAGEKWLAENAKKPNVKTTPSGLQYMVMKDAVGEKPTKDSKVTVHYHGTLPDGRVFDSSVDRGKPASFGLNQVIKGWTEGVQLMPVGSKFKFFIPSDLAYGERGAGGTIGPNEVLVFEVELISIDK